MRAGWFAIAALGGCLTRPAPDDRLADAPPGADGGAAAACQTATQIDPFTSGACGNGAMGGAAGLSNASNGMLEMDGGTTFDAAITCSWGTYLGTGIAVDIGPLSYPLGAYLEIVTGGHDLQLIASAGGAWNVTPHLDGDALGMGIDSSVPPTELRLTVNGAALDASFDTAAGTVEVGTVAFPADLGVKVDATLGALGDGSGHVVFSQFVICPMAE